MLKWKIKFCRSTHGKWQDPPERAIGKAKARNENREWDGKRPGTHSSARTGKTASRRVRKRSDGPARTGCYDRQRRHGRYGSSAIGRGKRTEEERCRVSTGACPR